MKIRIVFGDIFSIPCDAYANPTDIHLSGSGGLDKAIHQKAGPGLEAECAALRSKMKPGSTEVTSGGKLPVKFLLHTACPKSSDETKADYSLLAQCYHNLLMAADRKQDLHHLALPLIGTGISGYDLHTPRYGDTVYSLTAVTILSALIRFHGHQLQEITLVCSSQEKYQIMQRTYQWITGRGICKRSRIRGSLLGGAIGDALGYPVEFFSGSDTMIQEYIVDPLTNTALISDDTQMTLFTACGLLWGYTRSSMKGIGGHPWHYISYAYKDWLHTQYPDAHTSSPCVSWIRDIPELNARRAPGSTCLSALMDGGGSIQNPCNSSKGCGGVMRIAPIPLYSGAHHHWDQSACMTICAETAAITHGHPLGWMSAAALGNILYDIMENFSLTYAVQDTICLLQEKYADYPETKTMVRLLKKADSLAAISANSSAYYLMSEYNIPRVLGEGWVGEEALAVGLFCALSNLGAGFDRCVHNAVAHRGDSDSTASIAGQIWGAYFGEEAIPPKWLKNLELKNVILEIADDLTDDCQMSEYSAYHDGNWARKYLMGGTPPAVSGSAEPQPHIFKQMLWQEDAAITRRVTRYDIDGNRIGEYEIQITDGQIYHAAKNKADAQAGSPGFGIVTLKYDEKKQLYTECHGWLKKHPQGTITGYYNNIPFTLLPNYADRCVEIFSHTTPTPWIGTIRRRTDEWDNPVELEFRDPYSTFSSELLGLLVSHKAYLRDFFG